MKPPAFDYVAVTSPDEAVAELARHGDDAKLLAGGQSLVPILNLRLAAPARLVDLNRARGLAFIEERGGGLAIGAMTRQRTVERSALAAARVPLLTEALPWVGHTAIRHRGTVGGSLAHADPAAELPAVALCLDARLTVRDATKERVIGAREFFTGYLSTALASTELLSEVWFPSLRPGSGAAWMEIARRHGDFALAGVAAVVTLDGDVVREARLALTGVDAVPVRATAAERALVGAALSADSMAAAADAVRRQVEPHTDIHATAAYRRHVAGVLTVRALARAGERARRA
ncbi:MAG: xanthine dehydrogenase family protein subunit M [Candidatus Rokubacteria bacterium]|nr:xanthine dehydrogenase family protein subunit M [Candidatus Rokubacteria bacterium]